MPSINGQRGGVKFRSMGGRGQWVPCGTAAVVTVGAISSIQIPKSLPGDFLQRGWHGAVPAIGVRVQGSINSDFAVGASTLKCTKQQRGTFVDVLLVNKYTNPMAQSRHDLTRLSYLGMLVNPLAEMLDREFEDASAGPSIGITPQGYIAPDIGIAGSDAKPFIGDNEQNYPALDFFDSFWRQLEGQVPIRTNGAATTTTTFDDFFSIPLCHLKDGLEADSIPLDTVCDLDRPWELTVRVNRAMGTSFSVGGTGSATITSIALYVYVIAQRDTDPRTHGNPYIIRQQPRSQSPLQYLPGEIVLFSGNLPLTQDTTRVDTVDAVAYLPGLTHLNFATDITNGNTLDWNPGGAEKASFPYWYQDRNPAQVYHSIANGRRNFHLTRYQRTAAGNVPVVRSGRALAGLGFVNITDADKLSTLLGSVSPWPCRILAMSCLERQGFPGFGGLDRSCAPPFIELTGAWDFTGTLSSINGPQNMFDVVVNNSPEDRTLIEDLGRNCCKNGTVKFSPTAANPDSPKADLVAGKLTDFVQVLPKDLATATDTLNTVAQAKKV